MKTAVVFKWTRNPADAIVSGGNVDWGRVKMSPTDDDPAAMDAAKALCGDEEILGITVGDGKPEWAAARGAASTLIAEGVSATSEGTDVASAIAACVEKAEGLDVVCIGDSAWDRAAVAALIGKLGWSAYAGVVKAEPDGANVKATVKTPDGLRVISAATPVLLCVQGMGKEQDAPGMKQVLVARKKPVEKFDAPAASGLAESLGTRAPEASSATLFEGEVEEQVAQLVAALRSDGVL